MTPKASRRGGARGRGCHGDGRRRGEGRRGRVRDEDGQFVDSVESGEVLAVFDVVEGPVVTSTDVADVLGITTEAARQNLNELVAERTLRRRKTGRTIVYWCVEDGDSDHSD